jgi:hypothetical protein
VVFLIVVSGAFIFLTRGHTPNKTAAQYITDVAKDDSMQPQLDQSLHTSPANSSTIVHDLVVTLLRADRRLSTEHWPTEVEGAMESLVTTDQQTTDLGPEEIPVGIDVRAGHPLEAAE